MLLFEPIIDQIEDTFAHWQQLHEFMQKVFKSLEVTFLKNAGQNLVVVVDLLLFRARPRVFFKRNQE